MVLTVAVQTAVMQHLKARRLLQDARRLFEACSERVNWLDIEPLNVSKSPKV